MIVIPNVVSSFVDSWLIKIQILLHFFFGGGGEDGFIMTIHTISAISMTFLMLATSVVGRVGGCVLGLEGWANGGGDDHKLVEAASMTFH